jgi:hypothetical protein
VKFLRHVPARSMIAAAALSHGYERMFREGQQNERIYIYMDCTYLYMIRVAIKVLIAPSSAVERSVEKDYEPVVCHVQHQLMRLGHARARLGNVDFCWKVILPNAELQAERRINNPLGGMKALLSNSLHLCYAELVCSLANAETRKVAAIVGPSVTQV